MEGKLIFFSGVNRWCRDMSKPAAPEEQFYLPFAVMEVKFTGVTTPPKWLETLLKSDYVIPSHSFCKFFHGSARLFPLRCRVLPPWFAFPSVSQPGFPLKHWYRQGMVEAANSVRHITPLNLIILKIPFILRIMIILFIP